MNRKFIAIAPLALGLLVVPAPAQIRVQDNDNEGRNAYQERCSSFKDGGIPNSEICTLPALPAGKRLAIRFISVRCNDLNGFTRNQEISVSAQLASSLGVVASFVPNRVTTTPSPTPRYTLTEHVFMHTDRPPSLFVTWEGTGSFSCASADVFGYLIDK
ncbi:MAG: hypothetical protein ACRD7E_02215 [Bryobacteraceae bacterium]